MTYAVIHWSGTGNTEKMAELIAQELKSSGKEVSEHTFENAPQDIIQKSEVLVLGAPAMGEEEIDVPEVLEFLNSAEKNVSGKKLALFGSYGWGDGEWMRAWQERMEKAGAKVINEPLTVLGFPDGVEETRCVDFAKEIANY
ncbi:MAG: flavodoxin domain-containing protein [Alphaproteobacteria bacterium]|nr:flavodoxin domain-containing protein [Alphaproteobacteria bacterium]